MRITYVGHATVIVEGGGARVMTDPLLTRTVLGLPRRLAPRPSIGELDSLDAITISHAHADHLHVPSLRAIGEKFPEITAFVPKGTKSWVAGARIRHVIEMEHYTPHRVGGLSITAIPLPHERGRWFSWQDTDTVGYIVSDGHTTALCAGDIDFVGDFSPFVEVGRRYAPSVACLPIAGMMPVSYYEKRRGRPGVHIDPATALEIARALGVSTVIPIHWGVVNLRLSDVDEAPRRLVEIGRRNFPSISVSVLWPGESWSDEDQLRKHP